MYAWQIFYRRNRQMLIRAGAIVAVVICGILAFAPMPGSGANSEVGATLRPTRLSVMLSPHRLETAAFVAEYMSAFH